MRQILASMVLVVLLFPSLALGGELKYADLVKREGLLYKKFSDFPFTGKTTGKEQRLFEKQMHFDYLLSLVEKTAPV